MQRRQPAGRCQILNTFDPSYHGNLLMHLDRHSAALIYIAGLRD